MVGQQASRPWWSNDYGECQPCQTAVSTTATVNKYVSIYLSCVCFHCIYCYNYNLTRVCLFVSFFQPWQWISKQHGHGERQPWRTRWQQQQLMSTYLSIYLVFASITATVQLVIFVCFAPPQQYFININNVDTSAIVKWAGYDQSRVSKHHDIFPSKCNQWQW